MKRIIVLILLVIAIPAVLAALFVHNVQAKIAAFKAGANPKVTVTTTKVEISDWRQHVQAVGSVRALRGVDVSTEVSGIITALHFESGGEVKAGAPLVQLYSADEEAQLRALEANAALAKIQLDRDTRQLAANAISQNEFDTADANYKAAQAQADQQRALLAKKNILAPFAGSLGIRQVDLGQYLNPGDKIVTLQTLDPIYVDFSVPQQSMTALTPGLPVSVSTDALPGQTFTGTIKAIDSKIDTDTRNVQVRAVFANPKHQLLPGMYAQVSTEVGSPQPQLTLPQTAVTFNPYGQTVYVVTTAGDFAREQAQQAAQQGAPAAGGAPEKKADDSAPAVDPGTPVVRQVFVVTGATRGDQVAIIKGLKEGDEVVTSGALKLHPGAAIAVDNSVLPSNDAAPTPPNE